MAKEKVLILYLDWFRTDPVLDGKFPFLARAIHAHRGLWAIRSISWDDGFLQGWMNTTPKTLPGGKKGQDKGVLTMKKRRLLYFGSGNGQKRDPCQDD